MLQSKEMNDSKTAHDNDMRIEVDLTDTRLKLSFCRTYKTQDCRQRPTQKPISPPDGAEVETYVSELK